VKELTWQQVGVLLLATLLNLVTFAPPWMAALPGLGFRRAFVLTQASTASTYIAPGGAAVGVGLAYAILRGWGFGGGSVGLAVAVTGIWNQLALLGFPPVALALLMLQQERNALLQTVATLAGQLSVFALFLVSLRVLGVSASEVGAAEAFAAWSLTRLLGSLPITPGGVGVVEVGLTTALVGFGGPNAEVVAAVLVYRFLNIVPTLVLGLAAGATWRRHRPKTEAAAV